MSRIPILALFVCAAVHQSALAGPSRLDTQQDAYRLLRRAERAYKAVPELEDEIAYVVRAPGSEEGVKKIEIRLGPGRDVAVEDPSLQARAVGATLYVTRTDAPDAYVARPYAGDFAAALDAIVGPESSLFEPIEVAMRLGRSINRCIEALRFKQLAPLRITGFEQTKDDHGRRVDVIRLEASNGREELRLDSTTHFFSSLTISLHPPGSPDGFLVEIRGTFSPRILDKRTGAVTFDPGGRRAIARLADLDSPRLPTGGPAPDFDLETSDGGRVTSADLKGEAAVLDFWATWCAPCWKTLRETQRVADWAASRHLPVRFYAVNTIEQFPSRAAGRTRVVEFLKTQKIRLTPLLDNDQKAFRAFGTPGLPSLVILASDGTLFKYHLGPLPDFEKTVEEDLRRVLARAEVKP